MHFAFLEIAQRAGDQVLMVDRLSVAVEGHVLVKEFSSVVRRGNVIAVVGPNGAGKSTLLVTLLGHHPPTPGSVRLGAAVTPAWFRQDLPHVPPDRSIYDCIADLRPAWGRGPVQNHLGCFFSGDEVQRSTSVLSGGELGRVALALIGRCPGLTSWCWTSRPIIWTSSRSRRSRTQLSSTNARRWW